MSGIQFSVLLRTAPKRGQTTGRGCLPASLKSPLQDHLKKAKAIHKRDLADGWGCVLMPDALDRKYPNDPGASRP